MSEDKENKIELYLTGLEISDRSYHDSEPNLRISFSLENKSTTDSYIALSPSCRITN
jgi:hypothetical protein